MYFTMKNGTISISVFGYLDSVREKHGISDKRWAKACGTFPARISEVRKLYHTSLGKGEKAKVGRAFTVEKFQRLLSGLRCLLGDELVRKEMLDLIAKADNVEMKILLAVSTLAPEKQQQLWLYLQALEGIKEG